MHRTHEMRMVRTGESGLEEWACPTCGRRILLRWPPHYAKSVLDTGDPKACHIARTPDETPDETPAAAAGSSRRLHETGADALGAPARPHVNPPEPV
ncbi:hypothetical protein [Actinomadura geliboluensis]|uniref:hypothetical protein n=1 Tax=Actinomadura geliboluensis TaxID=882440 RepID=UPI0036BE9B76